MKKLILTLVSVSILTVALVSFANGQPNAPPANVDIMQVLQRIVNWLFSILLVIAAIFIIIAGYMFVAAQGDPEKTKTARNFVMYALIGVLVGIVSQGLVRLVQVIVGT